MRGDLPAGRQVKRGVGQRKLPTSSSVINHPLSPSLL